MTELARLEVESRAAVCIARIDGEIDMSNVAELTARLESALPNQGRGLILDLTNTTYLDSAGIRLVLGLAARLRARRQDMRVIVPLEAPIRAVLELTALGHAVPMEARLDPEMIAAMAAEP